MRQSKMVERTELEASKAATFRVEQALNAIVNGEASKAYRVAETLHQAGYEGNSYSFRFVSQANGYDIAIVTFRCKSTGQRDSTHVYDVDAQIDYCTRCPGIWASIFTQAHGAWRADVNAGKEVAA